MKHINSPWTPILENWSTVQFDCVERWTFYKSLHQHLVGNLNGWRIQTTAEHVLGLMRAGHVLIDHHNATQRKKLDDRLLYRTIYGHDRGEVGSIFGDVAYHLKQPQHDRHELVAFAKEIEQLPLAMRKNDMSAFLLQFVLDETTWNELPEVVQSTLRRLRRYRQREALAFKFLERIDYLLYAYDNYARTNQPYVLTWTLRAQFPGLCELVAEMPELAEPFWTELERDRASSLLDHYSLVPTQQAVAAELKKAS